MQQIKDQIHTSKKLKQQCVHNFLLMSSNIELGMHDMGKQKKMKIFILFYTSNDIYPNIRE